MMRAERLGKEINQYQEETRRSHQRRPASEPAPRGHHSDNEADLSDADHRHRHDDLIPSRVVADIGRQPAQAHSQSTPVHGHTMISVSGHETKDERKRIEHARRIVDAGRKGQTIQVFIGDRNEIERSQTTRPPTDIRFSP
jgi:hypothetical protein